MPSIDRIIEGQHWTPHGFGRSVGLSLTDNRVFWGDCVGSVQTSEIKIPHDLSLDGWFAENQSLSPADGYGLAQAVTALMRETGNRVQVLADFLGREVGDAPHLICKEKGKVGYLGSVADGFEIALVDRHLLSQLGQDGVLLKRRIEAIRDQVDVKSPLGTPQIHISLHGGLSELYGRQFGQMLRKLTGFYGSAQPCELFLENPIVGDKSDWKDLIQFNALNKQSVALGAAVVDGSLPSERLDYGVLTVDSFGRLDRLKEVLGQYKRMKWFIRSNSAETPQSLTYLLDLSRAINASGIFLHNDHHLSIAYNYLH